jgi:alpha-glucosidase
VDGFRIDVAHGLVKDAGLRDIAGMPFPLPDDTLEGVDHPHWDQPGVHEVVGAPPTWVLGNHDVCRPVSRFARPQELTTSSDRFLSHFLRRPVDLAVGLRRARAAALLSLALPGGAYIYQGEELGLPEVEDIPWDKMQDPMVAGTNRTNRGRDGCRVPLPWTRGGESHGFSPDGADEPWLPQPAAWGDLSAEAQDGNAGSTLELYRAALRVRRTHPALGDGTLEWIDAGPDVVAFRRTPGFECRINLGADPVSMPEGQVLVASADRPAGTIPTDVAVWLQVG